MKKKFHIGDILSITTGKLVSLRQMDGIYDILNFLTQDNLFTHQLPRVSEECCPWLLRRHPQLKEVEVIDFTGEDSVKVWLNKQIEKYGEYLEIETIPRNDHDYIDPEEELVSQMGKDKVIIIRPE